MNLESRADKSIDSALGKDLSPALFRNALVYLVLLGLIIRAGYLVEHARDPSFGLPTLDQKYYDTVARMILAGEDLRQLHGMRPLLYPMFLAVIYKVFGAHGIDMAIFTQHLLGVGTGLLVALIAARLFHHRLSGLVAGALYFLAPIPLCFEGELLIESSYVFLICAALLLIFRAAERRSSSLWLASGAFVILIAQARPNILLFVVLFPLLAAWRWWHSRERKSTLPLWGLVGAIAMGIPWGFVNQMQSDRFQIIPSAGGVNLYFGNKRTADGMVPEQERRVVYGDRYEDSGDLWAREEYQRAMLAQGRPPDTNPLAVSQFWTHRALEEIAAAPGSWLHLVAKKCWLMFWNTEVPNNKSFAFLQTEFLLLRFLPVRWVVLLMLAPAGIWAARKWGNRDALFILIVYILVYAAGNVMFFVCDRYRYPIWPAMAALAGGGTMAFFAAPSRTRIFFWGSMAVMAAISLPNWFNARLPSFERDYFFHSIAWYETGHFPEALADINRSLALNPHEVMVLHQRGNILLAMSRDEEAREDLEETLKLQTDDAAIWNNYGIALDGVGRTNDALAAFRRATECQPPSTSAFFGMAFELIHLARYDEAAAALDQLAQLAKRPDAMSLTLRAVIARRKGDAPAADALEQQARQLDPVTTAWALQRANGGKSN